ncbi:MAG TPA: alpha/beta hydrolase [Casimicrobiaceae bacterium]|jgi:pimeloyl-ACP methyl ester carboxylesterase|nr:alpha/beta hydrolase [Casimicrobiaceae bacterium]
MPRARFVDVAGHRLECVRIRGAKSAPTLVFLHEGLGSVALWKDFPARVADATGCPVLVYSRAGYGRSSPATLPRATDYMHVEALTVLPALLDRLGIADPVLVGHSDGASIALLHAGSGRRPVRALVALAPHVFVEDMSIASIDEVRRQYDTTDLRERLARRHADPDAAFRGWNDIWLAPAFRSWNIEACLPGVRCPLLMIQGRDDEYGSAAQLDAIERQAGGKVVRIELADCRHSPHRDQPEATLAAIADFVATMTP